MFHDFLIRISLPLAPLLNGHGVETKDAGSPVTRESEARTRSGKEARPPVLPPVLPPILLH